MWNENKYNKHGVGDDSEISRVADKMHWTMFDFTGPNRAGETVVAQAVRDDLSRRAGRNIPFPHESKEPPEGIAYLDREHWCTLAVICTFLDNDDDESWSFDETMMSKMLAVTYRFIHDCEGVTLQPMFEDVNSRWQQLSEWDRKHVAEFGVTQSLERRLRAFGWNTEATPEMLDAILNMPTLSRNAWAWVLGQIGDDETWERLLFTYGHDVARHPSCPRHLQDVADVAL